MPSSVGMPPSPMVKFCVSRPAQSPGYDLALRLPLLGWSIGLAFVSAAGLEQYLRTAELATPVAAYITNIAMRLMVIIYLLTLAAAVVVRMSPVAKSRGVEPRISGLIGTFLATAVVLFPRHELSVTAGAVSTLSILGGDALAVVVLVQLRRSFSIMPEARQLVTSGVYRFVRHPLYLAEGVATFGSVMQYLSPSTVTLFVVQTAFQLRRIRNEETLLEKVFPEYIRYKDKTARFIPGVY